ncbi:2-keto-myo-inositol dehydratase [Knoellia remsis]|uniref:2-keto-myo-inositol dehydratase n=1 Tax=Knoellia remsis TaxID=407159 RepID=A0A2T0ULJ1_9MICO|nr:TIM barrel protein [Knoellia remsis]PRY58805.1 2-keto-myo-inositol dehydratase [Knoellia remsis]
MSSVTGSSRTPFLERVAGAPISWGVSEVAGWGHQLTPDTVLSSMRELGLTATEFGPDGFLPSEPTERTDTLERQGLRAVGQFVPVVLHDPEVDPLPVVEDAMTALAVAGAGTVVIAATTGAEGYDVRPVLGDSEWSTLLANLDLIEAAAEARGLVAALHPHVGTMIETAEEVDRVLAESRIGLCLDTGHLLIGGSDPVALAREHSERIVHVHLKDVRGDAAARVRAGGLTYTDAVADGMYVPLGAGDVDVAAIVGSLESAGYAGWYVLEQDTILAGPPSQTGIDPAADVRASLTFLRTLAERPDITQLDASGPSPTVQLGEIGTGQGDEVRGSDG